MARIKNFNSYFNFVLEDVTREVNIRVSDADFKALKTGKYKLCFAKKVNDQFNVVWQCYADFFSNNFFSWTPQFQLFGTNTFAPQQVVKTTTNVENCSLGNTCVLTELGFLEKQRSGGNADMLTITNEYGFIHSGVRQLSTGIGGEMISSCIYVAEVNELKGDILLAPKDIVCIWFQQNIYNGTMLAHKPSGSITLDLTEELSLTCLYKDQKWLLV